MTVSAGRQYDDKEELARYVLIHYASLRTEQEHRIIRAIDAEYKAAAVKSERIAECLRIRLGRRSDERVDRALETGLEVCRRNVVDRILRDHADQLDVNRCPECRRIVNTPKARQCFWCGHDWH